jgi:tetratricopeptide (TPR) repeat protein
MTNMDPFTAPGGHYSIAQLADILSVSRQRVRAWLIAGLIKPAAEIQGVGYFDFRSVAFAKTLSDLASSGLNARQIQAKFEELQSRIDSAALDQLSILEKNGQLLVRLESGLVDSTGQGYFDFDDDCAIINVQPVSADEWYDVGCLHEADGALEDAVHAYRQALMVGGPAADACFNLANALLASGKTAEAGERFLQAIELDHDFAEAWNNLGVMLGDVRQFDASEAALKKAIRLGFADAEFNLAQMLDHAGRFAEAREHWAACLKTSPCPARRAYACWRLAK